MNRHILIVGGGIIGLCTAYYAARRGYQVTVLERSPDGMDGCSYGNGGMVVPSHFVPLAAPGMVALGLKWMWNPESPFYVRPRLSLDLANWGWKFMRSATRSHVSRSAPLLRDLHMASRGCYQQLAEAWGNDFGLTQRGLLMLCRTQEALDEEAHTAETGRAIGIPSEVLTAKETAALEPAIRMSVAGSVYFPNDSHLVPGQFMAGLELRLKQAGVEIIRPTEVGSWRTEGNRIRAARSEHRDFPADEFVVCAGIWSTRLVRSLGLRLPMQAGKGYSLTLPHPRQLPTLCAILTEARVAVTPMAGALRFAGTMELAGLDERINPARVRGIVRSIPEYFPDFGEADFRGVRPWCGLRPCSPDGLPYVGRAARYANLSVATGHAMMGVSLGPVTGMLMAEVLSGDRPSVAIGGLSPRRFS